MLVFQLVLIFVMNLFVCSLIHEIGHAIIAIACGGKISRLKLGFDAYIETKQTKYNKFTKSLMYANGTIFPNVIILFLLLFYKKDSMNFLYQFMYFIFFMTFIFSFIPWLIIPLLKTYPENDDVTFFIQSSQLNPLSISLVVMFILIGAIILFVNKGMPKTFFHYLRNF